MDVIVYFYIKSQILAGYFHCKQSAVTGFQSGLSIFWFCNFQCWECCFTYISGKKKQKCVHRHICRIGKLFLHPKPKFYEFCFVVFLFVLWNLSQQPKDHFFKSNILTQCNAEINSFGAYGLRNSTRKTRNF